ncbi:Copia type Polyprotein [Phytophthora megakarya]|uniref:Copia type Polyprotein n=1 Tax=Phytophthora megakarya TaxID=4795 RepID=A0A225VW89_9STRA|nr:Copia type Polyprotein [Phytophthora megakarya]
MSSSSDSEDSGKSKRKGFKIGSSGTPVRWDGEDWTFYKNAMVNAFEKSLLDGIADGTEKEDPNWTDEEKGKYKKKQAKVKILIQGSLSMRLAKQVMAKPSGTEMWQELVTIYEGKNNPAMKSQKVYRLQCQLHRINLTGKDDVRSHLYKLFDLKDRLADLGAPVNDLQMVDKMLRSLPATPSFNELRRKVLFSSNMGKYTPDLVRELILTAELRSKDWDNNAFGNKQQGKKTPAKASSEKKGNQKPKSNEDSKPKAIKADIECFNCGGNHYKSNCPDLLAEEKQSGRKNPKANYARSDEKNAGQEAQKVETTAEDSHKKRDVVVGEVAKRYFTVLQDMEDSDWNSQISGFADGLDAKAEGFGTIKLAVMIDEQMVFVFVEDVLYVPSAGCNLFSPGLALDQGFMMTWNSDARIFGMTKDDTEVIRTAYESRLWTFNTHNIDNHASKKQKVAVKKNVIANFAVTDGVEDIDVWHERLGHTCPEYIRLMVDRGMAKGIMLKRRGKIDCADCHVGKQRRKTFRKSLDRQIQRVNDMVFADLLIPGVHNGSRFTAVLVVMDGYSRFVKIYMLKSKNERDVNQSMQQYIAWAERQHGKRVEAVVTRQWNIEDTGLVKQVLTDKGKEFCNETMQRWYKEKGIVHTKVGPKASQLNMVERTHQTLIGMVKSMMYQSGLPKSFWVHALETAVYVKNRVFCKGAGRTPYELMYGSKPDIHHVRVFGSLTYCHTPKEKRTKLAMNCRMGSC